jgi:hypothetical protein
MTLLVLSPALGELLSGSSPPLQFFNPVLFFLLVCLYGCGALLVREIVVRRQLNAAGVLLLGAAYAVLEEGLLCKSFFNPFWTDTGFLSIYGRAWGVNWVWTLGLTVYHMTVSIAVPIFLTEALFPSQAAVPWLRRRGWISAGTALAVVTVLGFLFFDNRQFHLIEIKDPIGLARRLDRAKNPLDEFIAGQLTSKSRDLVRKAATTNTSSPNLRKALSEEFNRLLPRADLYLPERFEGLALPKAVREQTTKIPKGDELVKFNRALLEAAFPKSLAPRLSYPFRLDLGQTLICLLVILGLARLAFDQVRRPEPARPARRPWLKGLGFSLAFFGFGFVVPSLVEQGARIPVLVDAFIWCGVAVAVGRALRTIDTAPDCLWRRGLWALGVITLWVGFAMLLGLFVGFIGAKSFSGMTLVSLAAACSITWLARRWKRRLQPEGAGRL